MSWKWEKPLTVNLKPKTTTELKENIKNGTTILFANVEKLEKLTKELKKIKENTKLSSAEKQEKISEVQKEIKDCKEEIDFFQKNLSEWDKKLEQLQPAKTTTNSKYNIDKNKKLISKKFAQ